MSVQKRRGVALLAWALMAVLLWHDPASAEPALTHNEAALNTPSSDGTEGSLEPEDPETDNSEPSEDDDPDIDSIPETKEASGALAGNAGQEQDVTQTTASDYVDDAIDRLIRARPNLKPLVVSSLVDPADLVTQFESGSSLAGFTSASGAMIEAPLHSSRQIVMTEPSGLSVQVGLPGTERAATLAPSGRAVYSSVQPGTHIAVDFLDDATARLLAVIENSNGAKRLRYGVDANVKFDLIERIDGGVDIRADNGIVIAQIDAPWAYDAVGTEVPSRYSVNGTELLLYVDHREEFVYPIVADPRFRWGIITGTVYFSKSETSNIAAGSISTALVLASLPTGTSQLLAAYSAELAIWAVTAENLGKCLKVKFGATWRIRGFWRPGLDYGHYTREAGITCR